MSIYIITVREVTYLDIKIEANSEQEARDLIGMADDVVERSSATFDIIDIEEIES